MTDFGPRIDTSKMSELLKRGQESDSGKLEYKFKLTDLTEDQRIHLASQMKYRLNSSDSFGEAVYDIGITDDGFALGLNEEDMNESLENLHAIVTSIGAKMCGIERNTTTLYAESEEQLLEIYLLDTRHSRGKGTTISTVKETAEQKRARAASKAGKGTEFVRHVAEVIIRKVNDGEHIELRIGVCGNVDSGKSSTVGVLTQGQLDDGRGLARMSILRHKHEQESGRTSSIGQQIMGFNDDGKVVSDISKLKKITWRSVVEKSSKIVTLFDLAGHEDYFPTTLTGLTSNRPDYVMIIVGSNFGLQHMTLEHINVCLSLKIPFYIVVTKIDMSPDAVIKETMHLTKNVISETCGKAHYEVNIKEKRIMFKESAIAAERISTNFVPIFKTSNTTGEGLDGLKHFINLLKPRRKFKSEDGEAKFQVQEVYKIPGTGTVVGGMLFSGNVRVGDELMLGPSSLGEFFVAKVRSIQCKKIDMPEVGAGKFVCFGVPSIDRNKVKKNMFMLSKELDPKAIWEFEALIRINAEGSVNIRKGYQPFCNIGHIRQTCEILEILEIINDGKKNVKIAAPPPVKDGEEVPSEKEELSLGSGDVGRVRMRFCFRAEWLSGSKSKIIFREKAIKGEGMIISINRDAVHEPRSNKEVTKSKKTKRSRRKRRERKRVAVAAPKAS